MVKFAEVEKKSFECKSIINENALAESYYEIFHILIILYFLSHWIFQFMVYL